jgi:hypothetical protein
MLPPIASRSLCNSTKALLGLMFMSRAIRSAATPFTPPVNNAMTARYSRIGSLREWNSVLDVTENFRRQPEHFHRTGVSASV